MNKLIGQQIGTTFKIEKWKFFNGVMIGLLKFKVLSLDCNGAKIVHTLSTQFIYQYQLSSIFVLPKDGTINDVIILSCCAPAAQRNKKCHVVAMFFLIKVNSDPLSKINR